MPIVCECANVSLIEIQNAIRENDIKTIQEIIDITSAGKYCKKCIEPREGIEPRDYYLVDILKNIREEMDLDTRKYFGKYTETDADDLNSILVKGSYTDSFLDTDFEIKLYFIIDEETDFIREARYIADTNLDTFIELIIDKTVQTALNISNIDVLKELKNKKLDVTDRNQYTHCSMLLDNILKPYINRNKSAEFDSLSPIQKYKKIEKVIKEEIEPVLMADGGNLEVLDFEEKNDKLNLYIRYLGACSGCGSSASTLMGIEGVLRDILSNSINVLEA